MPLFGKPTVNQKTASTSTPINSTVTDVAADIATVPAGKEGMIVSILNDGPSDIRVAFDADATAASGLSIKAGESYADSGFAIATRVSAVSVAAGQVAVVRGVLWSG